MAIMKTGKNEIIVMGGTHRAVLALEKILQLNDIKIPFAIFQEDYPWDEQWLPELKSIAEKNNIPYHVYKSDEKLSSETIAEVNKLRSKAIIGIGTWRSLLPSKFWKNTQYGYIGIHGTLLPEYRGFAGLNWYKTSEEIHNFIRGQSNPFPGAYSFYQNKKFYIWKTSIPSNPKKYVGRIVGKVVERSPSGIVSILTKDGILKIEEISVDGKKIKQSQFIK